ncbi:MAG: hypothetical protein KJZ58_04940 [Flavobacteriales bacterium]|nr:hypothetical protein [Flavobacteriales bacterium]
MTNIEKAAMAYEVVCLHVRGKKYGTGDARDPSEKDLIGLAYHEERERSGKPQIGISPKELRKQIKGRLRKAIEKLLASMNDQQKRAQLVLAMEFTKNATCAEELGQAAQIAANALDEKKFPL